MAVELNGISWLPEMGNHLARLGEFWEFKAAIATGFTAFCAWGGMDATLVAMGFGMLVFESVLRLAAYLRRGRHVCRGMQRATARFLAYGLSIALAIFLQSTIEHGFGLSVPLVDWLMAWLILTDIASVASFLEILGMRLPKPLRKIIHRTRAGMEARLDTFHPGGPHPDGHDDGRRRHGRDPWRGHNDDHDDIPVRDRTGRDD